MLQRKHAAAAAGRLSPAAHSCAGDVWDDDGHADDGGQELLDREWRARREEHYNSGYREGLEAGKHEAVQGGFDEGAALRCAELCSAGNR